MSVPSTALLGQIVHGDRLAVLSSLPAECVDLTVTSPPYNCGKDYGTTSDALPWDEYWGQTEAWLAAVFRVTRPGCRLAVNLPWWMNKKPRRDVPFQFKTVAQAVGWTMLDKIIWIKGDSNNVHTSGGWGGGGCGWGTYLSPSGPSIRCASEPILIFSKGGRGRRVLSGEGRGLCVRGDMTKAEWMAWTLDVWFVRGASCKEHPAVFPVEIPRRLIKLYTYPGDVVLDPHNGAGATTEAASETGRQYIGIDANEEFCRVARRRVSSPNPAGQALRSNSLHSVVGRFYK